MAERVWAHPRHITPAIPPRGRRETLSLGAGYASQVPRRIPKVPDRHVTPFVAMRVKDDSRAQSLCGRECTGHVIYADIEDGVSGESFSATDPGSGSARPASGLMNEYSVSSETAAETRTPTGGFHPNNSE